MTELPAEQYSEILEDEDFNNAVRQVRKAISYRIKKKGGDYFDMQMSLKICKLDKDDLPGNSCTITAPGE